MDRLEAMSILIAVVDTGSFSAAGRKLGIPLPTLSRKVAELELRLGATLLLRSTRKLALTDAGATYIAACRNILELVGEAERAATGEYNAPRGDLVLTAPIVFGRLHVLPIVNDFLAAFPDINVRLTLSDRNADLVDDHIDLAVRIGPLGDSGMIASRLGSVRRVVCGSPAYFRRHGVPLVPAQLSDLTGINFVGPTSVETWSFKPPSNAVISVSVRSRLSVNTAEAAIDAAIAGIGVARVLSYQLKQAVERNLLEIVLAEFEPAPLPVHLLHVDQQPLPQKTRSFLDFAVPRLRGVLSAGAA